MDGLFLRPKLLEGEPSPTGATRLVGACINNQEESSDEELNVNLDDSAVVAGEMTQYMCIWEEFLFSSLFPYSLKSKPTDLSLGGRGEGRFLLSSLFCSLDPHIRPTCSSVLTLALFPPLALIIALF